MSVATRDHLINQIAMAKKCLADVEAKLARCRPSERGQVQVQIERGRHFRDDLQAVLDSYEKNTQLGKELLAEMQQRSEISKSETNL